MKIGITKSTIRYKKFKGKRVPLCDYEGTCKNKAYSHKPITILNICYAI